MVQGAYTTGAEGMLRMDYLPTDAVIRNNEPVVTAGSTLYPRDLILGYVADAGFDETGVAKATARTTVRARTAFALEFKCFFTAPHTPKILTPSFRSCWARAHRGRPMTL